jgi:hypothetical protein
MKKDSNEFKEFETLISKFLTSKITRRKMIAGTTVAGATAAGSSVLLSSLSGSKASKFEGILDSGTSYPQLNVTYAGGSTISDANRLALRALWDAIVPGIWNGNEEDGSAPGADQTYVEAWLEQVATAPGQPISWLTAEFLNLWGADVNAWAQVTTFFTEEFYQLGLGTSIILPPTRQGKVILMMNLLVPGIETIFDLQYLGAIMLSKLAFFGDFYFEANDPSISVGRAYCGAALPPGTTPYQVDSFNLALGLNDPDTIIVNGLVNAP